MSKRKLIVTSFLVLFLIVFFYVIFLKRENRVDVPEEKIVANKIELKIGYITDLHCYSKLNSKTNKWEVNWRCSQPMANFTKQMNENYLPDVIIEGGDMVDGRDDQEKVLYPVALNLFDSFKAPVYHILGNHETRGFLKSDWLGFTGYDKPYYYIDVREYRLIVLDGNNKPGENGTSIETSPDLQYYPGYLDQEQKIWLEKTLQKAEDKTVLIFIHQPPLNKTILKDSRELFFEGDKIRELFSQYGVKAVFSGHIEELCNIEEEGVEYYILKGVHKDNVQLLEKDARKDQGIFYEILIDENQKVIVKMFFKEENSDEYDNLIVNKETAFCNNQSIQNPEEYKGWVDQEKLREEQEEQEEDDNENE